MSVVSLKHCIIPPELYPLILLCPNVRSQLSKSIYMSGSKKLGYQGVCVPWMNFQVCNETCIHWHFKLKEEESHCPACDCFQLLAERSLHCDLLPLGGARPPLQKQWLLPALPLGSPAAQICLWQQQSSETAAARSRAIAPQRCH